MAVPVVTNTNNQQNSADATTDWSSDGGGGAGPQAETDFIYQGTGSVSRKVGTTKGGQEWVNPSTSVNMASGSSSDRVWMFKGIATNSAALVAAPSFGARIGSASGAYYEYYLRDEGTQGDIDYPIKGGWIIEPIDPNVVAWRDAIAGTPSLTAVTKFGIQGDFTGSSKSENLALDALDLGDALGITAGTSTDPKGTFQDFLDHDEGTIGNRFGHISSLEGILFYFGGLHIGANANETAAATEFEDSNKTIVFTGGRVAAAFNRLFLVGANAGDDIDLVNCTFQSKGRTALTHFFSSAGQVDGTNEELDITAHGFSTGDLVTYSDEGGTAITGLTDATDYFVRAVTADAIALYAVGSTVGRQNSYSDTTRVGMTAAGTAERHKLTRLPRTVMDLVIDDAVQATATIDLIGCTFENLGLTSGESFNANRVHFTDCVYRGFHTVTVSDLVFTGCFFDGAIIDEGAAALVCNDLSRVSDCEFTWEGRGHAIEINTTGSHTLAGNVFSGYGPDREQFDTETDVTGGATDTIDITTHPWATGDLVYYNDEGGAETIGLTDGDPYYVRSVDANTIALYDTADGAINDTDRIDLTASGGGSGETQSLYSGYAAIYNSTSSGTVTITVTGGASPTVRNAPGATTVINNNTEITLTGLVDDPATEIRVYSPAGSTTEVAGIEDSGTSFAFSLPQGDDCDIRIFNICYLPADILNFTIPAGDTSIPIQQVFDRNQIK